MDGGRHGHRPGDVALVMPREDAERLLRAGPGYPAGSMHEVKSAWPSASGAAPPGMAGEPLASHEPGGDLERKLLSPAVTITEQLYNVSPDASWFSPIVSPSNPVQFSFGSFQVPKNQHYWLFDYEFQVMVQSGIDPNDVVPAVSGRFFGILGFDITFTGKRLTATSYQLDPHPAFLSSGLSPTNSFSARVPQQAFDTARFNSFASATGSGLSLMPTWRKLMGARQGPFALIAQPGDIVNLTCAIFRPVPTAIAGITARHAGYQIGKNVSEAIINRLRPR